MAKFNLNDRPVPSGSKEPRFNPRFGDDSTLNHNLGPRLPKVSATDQTTVSPRYNFRKAIGLPSRFDKS